MRLPWKITPGMAWLRKTDDGGRQAMVVTEVRDRPESDWTDVDREYLAKFSESRRRITHLIGPEGSYSVRGPTFLEVVDAEHHTVCSTCREFWPCKHIRDERDADTLADELKRLCGHCFEPVGRAQFTVTFPNPIPDGDPIYFHGRLKNGCGDAAAAYAAEHGHTYRVR